MGGKEAADSAWGPGLARKGFLEEGGRASPLGENQLHGEGRRDRSLPGGSGEGLESGLGLAGDQPRGRSSDSEGDRCSGTAGGRKAGSRRPQTGGLGCSGGGKGHGEDPRSWLPRLSQEQHWDAQLGPGTRERAPRGSQAGHVGSRSEGEGMEILQGQSPDEVGGEDGLSGERGRGAAGAAQGSGTDLGDTRGRRRVGAPGALEPSRGRGSSSMAGRGPESWGSRKGSEADRGDRGCPLGSGESPGQTSECKDFQGPPISGGGSIPVGPGGPEAKAGSSLQEAGDGGPRGSGDGGRGYTTSPAGPGGPGGWERGPQGLRGREGPETAGTFGEAEDGSSSPQDSRAWTAGQRGTGEAGRRGSEGPGPWDDTRSSPSKSGAHCGPGVLGSGGGQGGEGGTQVAGLMGSGRGVEARSHRLRGPSGPGGTLGDTDGFRGAGAMGSEPDFWDGPRSSREKGPGGEMGCGDGTGRGGLRASATGAGPRGSGRIGPWGQTGDYGGFRAPGALGASGEGGHEDGSGASGPLRAAGKVRDADGARGLGAGGSGDGASSGGATRGPPARAPRAGPASESRGADESGEVLGPGQGSRAAGPLPAGSMSANGGASRGLEPGAMEPRGAAGFRGGSGGLGATGSGGEAGYRGGSGGSGEMGSGAKAADRGPAAGQGALAPQGSRAAQLGGGRMGAGLGGSAGTGQGLDSSRMPGERGRSVSGSAGGRGESHAWGPGWEDQGSGQDSTGARDRPPGSRASSSMQEEDATFGGTHEGPQASWGWEGVPGREEAGGGQSPGFPDGKTSGLGRSRASGPGDSGVPGKGTSAGRENGSAQRPGDSGRQGAWEGPDGRSGRKGSGDGSQGTQGPGSQLGTGQRGGRGFLREQGSLEAKEDTARRPGALKEYEGRAAKESGRSERRLGPFRSRTQTWSRVEVGAAKRWGAHKARDPGEPPGAEDRGCPGKAPSRPGSRKAGKEGGSDVGGQRTDATRSPGSRHKPGAGGFSQEAWGKCLSAALLQAVAKGGSLDTGAPGPFPDPGVCCYQRPPFPGISSQFRRPPLPPCVGDAGCTGLGALLVPVLTPRVQSTGLVELTSCGSPYVALCDLRAPHLPGPPDPLHQPGLCRENRMAWPRWQDVWPPGVRWEAGRQGDPWVPVLHTPLCPSRPYRPLLPGPG